jgi:hypothetical protein
LRGKHAINLGTCSNNVGAGLSEEKYVIASGVSVPDRADEKWRLYWLGVIACVNVSLVGSSGAQQMVFD